MPEFEDSVLGAGIAGDPTPIHARKPKEIQGNTARQVNRTRATQRGPEGNQPVEEDTSDAQPSSSEGESSDSSASSSDAQSSNSTPSTKQSAATKPPPPRVDWGKMVQQNAGMVYHVSRNVADGINHALLSGGQAFLEHGAAGPIGELPFGDSRTRRMLGASGALLDPTAMSTSVHNIYEQHTAQSELAKALILEGPVNYAANRLMGRSGQQEEQQGQLTGQAAVIGGDPTNLVPLVGSAKWPARVAMLMAPALLYNIEHEGSVSPNDAVWAGATSMMLLGHPLPGPVRDMLERVGGERWRAMEANLRGAMETRSLRDAMMQDPKALAQHLNDLHASLEEMHRSETVLAKGIEGGRETTKAVAVIGPEGLVGFSTKEAQKEWEGLLKKYGVEDVKGLAERASEYTPQQLQELAKDWRKLGMNYDLVHVAEGERPLLNPARHIEQLTGNAKNAAIHSSLMTRMYLDHLHEGPWAHADDPVTSLWRSIIGHHRTTDWIHDQWLDSQLRVLGDEAKNTDVQNLMRQAVEGSDEAYGKLSIPAQHVVDSFASIRAGLRKAGKSSGYRDDFLANWWPRRPIREVARQATGDPERISGLLTADSKRHRAMGAMVDEATGQIKVGPRYLTTEEANKAVERERQQWLLENPGKTGRDAQERYPKFETNFLRGLGVLKTQAKGIHSHIAVQQMLTEGNRQGMIARDGENVAVNLNSLRQSEHGQREIERLRNRGYRTIEHSPWFDNLLVHPEMATLLERGIKQVGGKESRLQALARIEALAVQFIMYSPMIHGMNMAGRLGAAVLNHPMTFTHQLMGEIGAHKLSSEEFDARAFARKMEAYRNGVVPHSRYAMYGSEELASHASALGEVGMNEAPGFLQDLGEAVTSMKRSPVAKALGAGKAYLGPHGHINNVLWKKINDFGVMMYHVEKEAALRSGVSRDSASLFASRRAMSWMGHVAPEDSNAARHQLYRTLFFAPNWWRSFGELLTHSYNRTGWGGMRNPQMRNYIAKNEIKSLIAIWGLQKLSGNALNYAFSGHFQDQNQPGRQDNIEISRPWAVQWLRDRGNLFGTDKINPATGEDPRTGGRLYVENPLTRQQRSVEQAAGLQSGQPGWSGAAALSGAEEFTASRLSPVINAAAAAINLDLYRSAQTGTWAHVDPSSDSPTWASTVSSILQLTPGGYAFNDALYQAMKQSGRDQNGSLLPTAAQELLNQPPAQRATGMLLSFMGINPPYEHASRTAGRALTDDQYREVGQMNQQYDRQMQQLNAEALSGQMAPDQWLSNYRTASQSHSAEMKAFFKDSPEYRDGTLGLINQYESLYEKHTLPDGTLDQEGLYQDQAKFQHDHAQQWQAIQSELHKRDQTYPMLRLYHQTLDAYHNWQDDWAHRNGYDGNQIRSEVAEYNKLYNDRTGRGRYLQQHPELSKYLAAKRGEFERSSAGVMYELFYNPKAAQGYLSAHHQTVQQFEQQQLGQAS